MFDSRGEDKGPLRSWPGKWRMGWIPRGEGIRRGDLCEET